MGFFDIIGKLFSANSPSPSLAAANLTPEEQALFVQISRINASGGQISPELYQKFRDFEIAWLDRHYNTSSVKVIDSIPVQANLPRAPVPAHSPMKGPTGEVYYFLRYKAYKYEESGNLDLALSCMRKSVALVELQSYSSIEDFYPLVKMLARFGFVDEAYAEKSRIDQIFSIKTTASTKKKDPLIEAEAQRGNEFRDYLWLQENIPEKCPKSVSSYRRMKTQNTKNFQTLQALAAEKGRNL